MSSRSADFPRNAIAVLEADHRALLQQFERILAFRHAFERQREWQALSEAMKRHMAIEAEIFYPAFLDATEDSLTHFVASVGHENIAAEMQDALKESATSANFVSRVRALKKVFMHHVSDMEEENGMFDEARRSSMDHETLARLVHARLTVLDGTADNGTETINCSLE
jgi:Hemerythrin HHE cation binding domain